MIVVGNRPTQDTSQKSQFIIFQVLKNIKKGYIEMTKKIYLETFEKCPGSVYFPLLISVPWYVNFEISVHLGSAREDFFWGRIELFSLIAVIFIIVTIIISITVALQVFE